MSSIATQTRVTDQSLAVTPACFWRLSVAQYHQMIEADILTPDDRVELLEGWLISKMPKKPPHSVATKLTRDVLTALLPSGWFVNTQEPITLADSEPEPDAVIVRGGTRDYLDRHPGPQDIPLVVEVADPTIARDRKLKQRIYARAGIPVYWIINPRARRVEVYSTPTADEVSAGYQNRHDYTVADELPVLIEGREIGRIRVADLLP